MSSCPNCTSNNSTKFSDFGKNVSDFFSKEFPAGQVRVEIKSSAKPSVGAKSSFSDEFKLTTVRDIATGAISAEVKNTTCVPLGIGKMQAKSTTTLHSCSLLTQQISLCNAVLEGLKLDVTGSLQGNSNKNTKVALEFVQPAFSASANVDVFSGPTLGADATARIKDFLIGGEVNYDIGQGKIEKYSTAVSFDRPREKIVIQALTGFNIFNAAYYQKFNDQVEVAYRANWNSKLANLTMEIGAKCALNGGNGGFVKAKLDNTGHLGVALASDLRPGMQLILGASMDTTKLAENNHKFGLELNYSA